MPMRCSMKNKCNTTRVPILVRHIFVACHVPTEPVRRAIGWSFKFYFYVPSIFGFSRFPLPGFGCRVPATGALYMSIYARVTSCSRVPARSRVQAQSSRSSLSRSASIPDSMIFVMILTLMSSSSETSLFRRVSKYVEILSNYEILVYGRSGSL